MFKLWTPFRRQSEWSDGRVHGKPLTRNQDHGEESFYWEIEKGIRLVFGTGRFRVAMMPGDTQTVSIEDSNQAFSLSISKDSDDSHYRVSSRELGGWDLQGEFQQLQAAIYSLIRLILNRTGQKDAEPTSRAEDVSPEWEGFIREHNIPKKLKIGTRWASQLHRSGWSHATRPLASLHDPAGVLFDSFIEANFMWDNPGRVYREPWIGVVHIPCSTPAWAGGSVLDSERFRESLPFCQGLFVLSDYHRRQLVAEVGVPVSRLYHPSESAKQHFSFEAFQRNPCKKIVQIGSWLRHPNSFYHLQSPELEKIHLDPGYPWESGVRSNFPPEQLDWESVRKVERLSDRQYDECLSQNLVFMHLLDASANNTVIECILRHTPLLINRHPAVEEYLGENYPFYFENIAEAGEKSVDQKLIMQTHRYLEDMCKERFSREFLLQSFVESTVYRQLRVDDPPGCSSIGDAPPSGPVVRRRLSPDG